MFGAETAGDQGDRNEDCIHRYYTLVMDRQDEGGWSKTLLDMGVAALVEMAAHTTIDIYFFTILDEFLDFFRYHKFSPYAKRFVSLLS